MCKVIEVQADCGIFSSSSPFAFTGQAVTSKTCDAKQQMKMKITITKNNFFLQYVICVSLAKTFSKLKLYSPIYTSIYAYICLYWSVISFYTVITVAAFYSNKTFICRRQRLSSNGRRRHVSTGARLSIKAESQLDLNLFFSFFSKKQKKRKNKTKIFVNTQTAGHLLMWLLGYFLFLQQPPFVFQSSGAKG